MYNNYTVYHIHSMLSSGTTNIDSITDFHDYVDAASKLGMTAMAFTEHGNIFAWLKKKEYIESKGMKYIHGVEAYITFDEREIEVYSAERENAVLCETNSKKKKKEPDKRIEFEEYFTDESTGFSYAYVINDGVEEAVKIKADTIKLEKTRKTNDNYHCVLLAKNYDGVKELNKLCSRSFNRKDHHFYGKPRIPFVELIATSDNILITTACLGGILHNGSESQKEAFISFLTKNRHRCWLEIQHHNCPEQIEYNRYLHELSKATGIPLIAGTDTHALNDEHMLGREILQKAKGVHFKEEDVWDLKFKSYPELVDSYKLQGSLPELVFLEAIEETNRMADMVEEFKIDYKPKYPKLYNDSERVFREKIEAGIKWRGIDKYPNAKEYYDKVEYEIETFKHNGAVDFMLLEENYKSEMRKKGVRYGYSRGSVSGSIVAYILGITEIDSIKYNLNFARFMNTERVSLAD